MRPQLSHRSKNHALRSGTVDANEKCKVSNQPNRLSALFPSMRRFTTHATCNGI
jgi:hypothetical protein